MEEGRLLYIQRVIRVMPCFISSLLFGHLSKETVRRVLFGLLLVAVWGMGPWVASAQSLSRSIAILEVPEDDGPPDPVKTYGAQYLAETAGLPFTTTASVDSAATHGFVIATSGIDATTFSPAQRDTLRSYVDRGGVLVAGNFKDPNLFDLFGITGESFARDRHRIQFLSSQLPETFSWMDESREQTISLGDPERDQVIFSRSYQPQEASVLARFDDESPALTRHEYGDGAAYLLGVSLRDVTIRNQMNRDFTAQRTFSNGFEPSGDVFPLLVRSLFRTHVPTTVWKHTAPLDNQSTLIISHDVDSESGMVWMNQFAEYEQSQGITANYYITTHYIDDNLGSDYYTPYRDSIAKLDAQDQRISSHSVGHFPDFDELPLGALGNTRDNYTPFYDGDQTEDGTILGELEVSQNLLEEDVPQDVISFRSGFLLFPDKLVNGLDTLGYRYNSTFSANTVMTSFPYRTVKGRSFGGPVTDVWEVPMTISDIFRDEPISEDNWPEKVDVWLDAQEKYAANGSPVVLLIHPNRGYKIDAEQSFVEQLPSDVAIVSTEAFGQFWKERVATSLETIREGQTLTIRLSNRTTVPDSLSLVVDDAADVESILLRNADGQALSYESTSRPDGTLLIHSATPAGDDLVAETSLAVDSDGPSDFGTTGVGLRFWGTEGEGLVTVQKFGTAPTEADNIPDDNVSDFRFVMTAPPSLSFDSTEVRFGVSSLSGIDHPEEVQVYTREETGSGLFAPLETSVADNGTPGDVSDDTLSVRVGSFSEFALASDSNPLPVEMTRFRVRAAGNAAQLTWTTASERGNAGFEVQRRRADRSASSWTQVGFVESAAPGGTSSDPISYRFADESLPYGADSLRYRLKQVDTDGTTQVTESRSLRRRTQDVELRDPAPNPVRQRAVIRYAVPDRRQVRLDLYDVLGRRVRTLVQGPKEGRLAVQLEASGLSSGVYFLRLRAGATEKTRRLTVVR